MHLLTEIITPKGVRVKPHIKILRGEEGENSYRLFVINGDENLIEVGAMRLDIGKNHVHIRKMNNWTITAPLSKRYSKVGLALHEIAFRESFAYGKKGRVVLFSSNVEADLFHWSCGFVPCIFETQEENIKIDSKRKSQIKAAITHAKQARKKGLASPLYTVTISPDYMFLPPKSIARLKAVYFSPPIAESPHTPSPVVLSPIISHPFYQKVEQLVSTGELSQANATDLMIKLLAPSHQSDKKTWELALSRKCLHALRENYFDGFAIGTYFSQTHSSKLNIMLNPWGQYAFLRFLVGWQDCEASYEDTLRFIFSDYGVKALESGLIKPEHFRAKFPTQPHFSQELYEKLQAKDMSADDLFSPLPNPKMLLESR